MINIVINDRKVEVEAGRTLLEAAQKLGLEIPALCFHKALLPYGACRLCLVEVSQNGRDFSVQAACTYPASEGLAVKTESERIIRSRKIVMELLLARCPEVEEIRQMAKKLGVEKARIRPKDKDCTLCGLCVRMCQERMGPAAVGFVGRGFKREIKPPYGVPSDICQACGACVFICPTGRMKFEEVSKNKPVPIPFEHNMGLNSRPAVYISYPQAVPNKASIDERYCVHLLRDKCGVCKEFCEAGAIDYTQKEKELNLQVGSIILSPGYDLFDANLKKEFGYDRYANVVTSLEFERILSSSGPYSGKILRPSDEQHPKKIAFIQCFGCRDTERNYCSSICCMYATKEAIIAKEHEPGLECTIFFIDLRAFGKGFEEYYERAKKLGIKYIRCLPSSIKETPQKQNLKIQYLDDKNQIQEEVYDLVVLSTAMVPAKKTKELAQDFGFQLNAHGFCQTKTFKPVTSSQEGVYVCGPFVEPKDIPETVMQASAAVAEALTELSAVRGSLIKPKIFPPERDVTGQEPRIGVFICHCGTNIAGVVNVLTVVEYARILPNVVYAENNLYTCSNDTQEKIKKIIQEQNLNRVVVASCTPRTHEPLFRNTVREAGLNPYLFEMANIRDQCSWVHMQEKELATEKAKDLVRMAVAKSRLLEPLYKKTVPVVPEALVIGAGLSGMTAALGLARQGFEVYLIEKEKELGGNLRHLHYLLDADAPQKELEKTIQEVKNNPRIHLYTDTKMVSLDGFIGNFKTRIIQGGDKEIELNHGVIIVATGAQEYKPTEYLYGQDKRVITQLELEEKLTNNKLSTLNSQLSTIVMVQCVGSRDDQRPYCSRICCQEAVKNALKLKEINPQTNVFVLYRDIRTYGFKESFYRQAREKGVIFIRYEKEKKPEVKPSRGGTLDVTVFDELLQQPVILKADLLVLSAGITAQAENKDLAQMLKVPLNQDNFFLEAHLKLRPVDFTTEGVFLCGLAHSPKTVDESIIQALSAATRASAILCKKEIELEANISWVVDEYCDGCAYCIDPCPYKAITLIEYMKNGSVKKTVEVNETACKGCGVCQATCPKKGIFVKGFKLEQIGAQVEALLLKG